MPWISLLAGLALATPLEDTAAPLQDTGDTGVVGLPTGTDTTDSGGLDTGVLFVPWSEGPGAAEISGEAGGHSWEGCSHAPLSPAWCLSLLWLVRRRVSS